MSQAGWGHNQLYLMSVIEGLRLHWNEKPRKQSDWLLWPLTSDYSDERGIVPPHKDHTEPGQINTGGAYSIKYVCITMEVIQIEAAILIG